MGLKRVRPRPSGRQETTDTVGRSLVCCIAGWTAGYLIQPLVAFVFLARRSRTQKGGNRARVEERERQGVRRALCGARSATTDDTRNIFMITEDKWNLYRNKSIHTPIRKPVPPSPVPPLELFVNTHCGTRTYISWGPGRGWKNIPLLVREVPSLPSCEQLQLLISSTLVSETRKKF